MIIKKIILSMIKFYQKYLSGLKRYSTCKYYPTCSNYAIEAIGAHGVIMGVLLGTWRILRCNLYK